MKSSMLIIDDEPGYIELIKGHFSVRGFDVSTAADGDEGIVVCGETLPDVILLDLRMRALDGDKAVPYLREIVPHSLIIVISAHADDIAEKKIQGLSVDSYFAKPVEILKLEEFIAEGLARPEKMPLLAKRAA